MLPLGFVEVCRSFSFKLNRPNYESRDFFCSQKKIVPDADAEAAADSLYNFCVRQVMKDVANYKQMEPAPTSNGRSR